MFARYIYGHPRYFVLLVLCVLAIGLNSYQSIPRQEKPTLTNMIGSIITLYPGATPARVEALVTIPLEDELRKIDEVEQIFSNSNTGVSAVNVRLIDTLPAADLERVWSEVRDAIDDATRRFPRGVNTPLFENDRLASFTSIIAFSSAGDADVPLSVLNRLSAEFASRARYMRGTRLVEVFGAPDEEIRVEIKQPELVSRGLSIGAVRNALQAADVKVASGRLAGAGQDLSIELAGEFDSLERIREVIVNTSVNGSATRIADVADVYKAVATPPRSMVLAEGRPALLVGAIMEKGRQVDTWTREFRQLVADFRADAPAGLLIETTFEQEGYARDRLVEVSKNLAFGVTLVLLVLFFSMGWRAAVVVAVVLPLCGLASIAVLERMDISLDQLSITGLIVAIGLLVDGSIVMTDEIRKKLIAGQDALSAIGASVQRMRVPLIASALTTILTFMPMALMPGPSGNFLGNLAWAVISMLVSSTLVALLFTPVLAVWLLPRDLSEDTPWYSGGMKSGRGGEWLAGALDWSLRNPWGAIVLALSLPVSGYLAFPTLTAQFFPGTDRDQMYIQVKLPDGRSIYDTQALVRELDARLREEPLIRRIDWILGESAPPFFYNMYRFTRGVPSWAEALILTRDENQTDALIRELQLALNRDFPQARIAVRGMDESPPVKAPLEIELHGPSLDVLRELGERYRQRMENLPHVTHSMASLTGGAPKLLFDINEEKLRLAGLQLTDAASALNDSLRGVTGGEVLEGSERLPVRVRLPEAAWGTAEQVSNLRLPLAPGTERSGSALNSIPLRAVSDVRLVPARSPIERIDGQHVNTVSGFVTRGVLPLEVLKTLEESLQHDPIPLPQGYKLVFGGDADARAETVGHIMAPMGLILSAMLATILITFNSWRLSAVAVLVCLCSFGLSLLALAIFRYPFGIMAFTGTIGSIGVSINAAIIILTGLQQDAAANRGDHVAVRDVVMDSSRHIVSTTATTFGGFLPLILEGSQFWPPFATAIAGGVLLSTIISFFLVPPLYTLIYRRPDAAEQARDNRPRLVEQAA